MDQNSDMRWKISFLSTFDFKNCKSRWYELLGGDRPLSQSGHRELMQSREIRPTILLQPVD